MNIFLAWSSSGKLFGFSALACCYAKSGTLALRCDSGQRVVVQFEMRLVSGHGFSRAETKPTETGFSPCARGGSKSCTTRAIKSSEFAGTPEGDALIRTFLKLPQYRAEGFDGYASSLPAIPLGPVPVFQFLPWQCVCLPFLRRCSDDLRSRRRLRVREPVAGVPEQNLPRFRNRRRAAR